MNSSQQIFFITAITLAVLAYGVFKLLKLRKGSRQSSAQQPKMRPPGTSSIKKNPGSVQIGPSEANSTLRAALTAASMSTDPQGTVAGQQTSQPDDFAGEGQDDVAVGAEDSRQPAFAASIMGDKQRQSPPTNESSKTPVQTSWGTGIEEDYPYHDQSDYAFGSLTPAIAALMPTSAEGRVTMTRALRNAGYYSPHAWHNMTAVRYLCMVLPILFFGILLILVPPQLETFVIISLVVTTLLGWALPALYIRSKAADRLREIGNAMPDMLDLLNMCVSQGMTVTSALGRVGRDIAPVYPALAKEMKIVTEQAYVGTLSQSLTNLSHRVDLPEIHSFSSLLVQTEQMGTSVSEALVDYSDNMRESLKQRSDEKANSATFKLLFPTVLCLMPAVYLFLLGPAVVELNRFFEAGGADALSTEIPEEYVTR